MPGLAGLVGAGHQFRYKNEVVNILKQVGAVAGVDFQHRVFESTNATILNTLTGLVESNIAQPASNSAGDIVLFLEGEIFNINELKARHSDHYASTTCDVLLGLFERIGDEFVTYVNGEFNIVVYEAAEKRLSIFSDHLASMPMYYMESYGLLLFGSEKKFILSLLDDSPTIDPIGLLQIVAHRYNLDDRTFLRDVKRLMPSTQLKYHDGRLEVAIYDALKFDMSGGVRRPAEIAEEWGEQLREAVNLRVHDKNRLLLSLSGGLDSRAIACAFDRNKRPIVSRTYGLDNTPETQVAADIADRLGFDHVQENPESAAYSDIVPKIVWRTECETHFMNALSIVGHAAAKRYGDYVAGGWLGDVTSGGHIVPELLLPLRLDQFLDRAYRRHLNFSRDMLSHVFSKDFLHGALPNLQHAFMASFMPKNGQSNIQIYEIWDLYQRQRRQTTGSMPIDSYLFEKIRPFYDKNYLRFTLTLPTKYRFAQTLYQSMIYNIGPEIRDIPSANNNLRLRRSLYGNFWNKGSAFANRVAGRGVGKLYSLQRSSHNHPRDNPGLTIKRDTAFRASIEGYMASTHFNDEIFNKIGIQKLLTEHYQSVADHSFILGYVATFAVGLPYFLNKTLQCPTEAEPI